MSISLASSFRAKRISSRQPKSYMRGRTSHGKVKITAIYCRSLEKSNHMCSSARQHSLVLSQRMSSEKWPNMSSVPSYSRCPIRPDFMKLNRKIYSTGRMAEHWWLPAPLSRPSSTMARSTIFVRCLAGLDSMSRY